MRVRVPLWASPLAPLCTQGAQGAQGSWGIPLILLLLTALLGGAAAQGGQASQNICPIPGDVTPCSCTVKKMGLDILCEATENQHINRAMDALKRRSNAVIFYLKLRHNNLPKLQQFVFLGLDIRHLTIHNSSLQVVEESSLSSVGKKLTQLDLSQNLLSTVPSKALSSLHHLLVLNLNHNKIAAIHNAAFQGLDTVEILTLYENKIDTIDDAAFEGLGKKLKRLNLGGNGLRQVPQKALATLEMLRKLEMQENELTEIREGDFAGLRNLDTLNLQHNRLNSVPAKVFSHLKLLNSLELENNQIKSVDAEAFAGLEENLQYLRLGDNKLNEIPSDALRRLHRLRHLDLRVNNITFIPDDAFSGFGDSITFLNLQKNALITLPSLAFENLNSLETLNLQNNKLSYVSEEVMEPIIDTVTHFDLSDNPLICTCDLSWYHDWYRRAVGMVEEPVAHKRKTMCSFQLEHREYSLLALPLDRMNCVGKNMGQISIGTRVIPAISVLYMVTVTAFTFLLRLRALPIAAFEKLHYLERLLLQYNQLLTIPEEVVAPFMDTLVLIEMNGNPFRCDCDLAWYQEWYLRKRPSGEEPRNAVCHMQSEHRDYNVQDLPLGNMKCSGKSYSPARASVAPKLSVRSADLYTVTTMFLVYLLKVH